MLLQFWRFIFYQGRVCHNENCAVYTDAHKKLRSMTRPLNPCRLSSEYRG